MYGLPKGADLQFLIGKELVQVCVGMYQVILRFYEELTISLECECEVIPALPGRVPATSQAAVTSLISLIGTKITTANSIGNGDLAAGFSDGTTLLICDSNGNTESYQIIDEVHEIIV